MQTSIIQHLQFKTVSDLPAVITRQLIQNASQPREIVDRVNGWDGPFGKNGVVITAAAW